MRKGISAFILIAMMMIPGTMSGAWVFALPETVSGGSTAEEPADGRLPDDLQVESATEAEMEVADEAGPGADGQDSSVSPAATDPEDAKADASDGQEPAEPAGMLIYEGEGYTVTLEYGDDAGIDGDTVLDVREITADSKDKAERKEYAAYHRQTLDTLKQERAEDKSIKEDIASLGFARFFDITLVRGGEVIEPAGDVSVKIEFDNDSREKVAKNADAEKDLRVVHIKESTKPAKNDGLAVTALDRKDTDLSVVKKELTEASFTTDSFSVYGVVYTVDFEYEGYAFSIEGESDILISELFDRLNIKEDAAKVQDVEFSDPKLIRVESVDQNGKTASADKAADWKLTSLKPFGTEEKMIITLPEKVIVIKVTDEERDICKIIDTNPDGGTQIGSSGNYEHPFNSLNEAVTYARNDFNNGSAMSASNPAKIEMLVDYEIPQTDKVTLDQANDNIIITTAATSGGTYKFMPKFTAEQGRSGEDSDEIAILQRGWKGSGTGNTALFYLNNASAKLKTENITLDGGYDTADKYTGRVVYVNNGDVCFMGGTTVENCHLESGTFTEGRGSAVYINNSGTHTIIDNSSDKDVIFRDCSVSGNENYDGACINIQKGSAIINNSGLGKVLFERITGNASTDGGAIGIEGSGNLTVNNTTDGAIRFVDCRSGQGGGALETDSGTITLNNNGTGTMEFLRCYNSNSYGGGAIYCKSFIIETNNGTIRFIGTADTGVESKPDGGAIYATTVSITGTGSTSFSNFKASGNGGAIYAGGAATLENVSFTNCTGNNGGGVYGKSTVSVTNGSFTNCTALTGTGGGIHSANKLSVSDSTFTDCSAKTYGGAIYINGPNSTGRHTISNCTFDGHKDLDENTVNAANGGAIYVNDGWLTLTGSQFSDLTCTTNGGAVYMDGRTSDSLTIEDCTFDGHDTLASTVKNASAGGAVYMNADSGITLKDITVSDCWTSGNGGGVYTDDAITSIEGTVAIENCYTTGGNGGGAYFYSTANLTGAEAVTFKNCHADSTSTSNGGGGAWFNNTATLDGAVSFEDCYTGGNGGAMYFANGGTMTGVNVDGHKTLDSAMNNAAKGGAIFLANSKTLTIKGGEIKNCSASNTNGGAINVGGSSAKVYFEGDSVVYDNKSTKGGQEVQANMVLDQNYNTIINTTENGLGTDAHIGVYVTGNNANPYNSHGKESQPFGTAANVDVSGGMQNVDRFTNDRKESLFGVSSGDEGDKLIYWSKPICKIIDTNPDGGTQIGTSGNYEHPFNSLNEAVTYARNSFNNGSAMSASNPAKIEMLVDYVIPERDKVTLDQAIDNIIITTAKTKTAAQAANETFYFEKTFNAAQGRLTTDSDATAILKRGDNGASLFTVNHASASLSTEDIIFDGGGITANTHGGFILGTKGAVTIKGGTTMRNSNVGTGDNYGGAVYSPNESSGAVITIDNAAGKTIEFINCTAGNGGAIKSYYKPLTVTNNGTLNFVNCKARHGGALLTEYNGANISISNTGTMLFDDCDATSGKGGAIGVYTSTSNVIITNTSGNITFKDCSASSEGGGIYANGQVSINGDGEASFSECTSLSSGGGIYSSGAVSITETGGTAFTKCSAVTGGAIYSGKDATLTNVTCGKANTADSGCTATDKGGCVYIENGAATLTDCSFYYGKAGVNTNSSDAQGGGVCYYGSNELKILGTVFDHCSTESSRNVLGVGNGGAVYVDKNAAKLTVDQSDTRRSSFTDCSAHRYGGAIHWERDGGTVEIRNADFTNCHSEIKGGGAVFTDSTTTNISNCNFNGCYTESTDSNYGGGGAIYTNADNPTDTSTISISDTTFSDCMVKKNGGAIQFNSSSTSATLTNVNIDGKKDRTTTDANAELGSAVYSKGNLTIKQSGSGTSEIRNCSASGEKGGAVNVTGDSTTMTFEGNVVVYGNTNTIYDKDHQHNVVLEKGNSTTILTSGTGLGADAHIGVYVTGNNASPYNGYGRPNDPFGTMASTDNGTYLFRFTNDRNNSWGVKRTDTTIYWNDPIVKVTDKDNVLLYELKVDNVGTENDVYLPAVYERLNDGLTAARGTLYTLSGTTYTAATAMGADNLRQMKMLKDYVILQDDKVTLDRATDNIIITTAETTAPSTADTYIFADTLDGKADADKGTAILKRGDFTDASLFDATDASAKIAFREIILDGDGENRTVTVPGGLVHSLGTVEVLSGTTMRNTKSSGSSNPSEAYGGGGAIWARDVAINGNTGSILFDNCFAKFSGGAIYYSHHFDMNDNSGRITFKDCSMNGAAKGDGGAISNWESGSDHVFTATNNSGSIEFINCRAENNQTQGGAIFQLEGGNITLASTGNGSIRFSGCYAGAGTDENCGGAISAWKDNVTISLTGTATSPIVFENCYAKTGNGGAIYTPGNVVLTNVRFGGYKTDANGNYVDSDGNALSSGEKPVVDSALACRAEKAGKDGKYYGGAVCAGGSVTYTSTAGATYTGCYGCYGSSGGAIYASSVNMNDNSGTLNFDGCYTTDSGAHGGAIRADGGVTMNSNSGNIKFNDCHSGTKNSGDADGGAIAVYGRGKTFSATANTGTISFENCTTSAGKKREGGAIILLGGTMTMASTGSGSISFKDCYADADSDKLAGGAISVWDGLSTITLTGTVEHPIIFEGCHTNGAGGAIVNNNSGTMNLTCVSFDDCYAEGTNGNGGAVYTNGTLNMTNVNITGHSGGTDGLAVETANAKLGGAVYTAGSLTIKQTGTGTSEIKNCSASTAANGGAVNVASGKAVYFEGNVVVYDNKGTGALANQQKNVVLDEDTNTKIYTTSAGLGTGAHIGVYVTGTMGSSPTKPFLSHGGYKDDFGTYDGSDASKTNLDRFTNDRVNDANGDPLRGELCPDHTDNKLIRWTGYQNVAPTGYSGKLLPYLMILLAGLCVCGILYLRRKLQEEEIDETNAEDMQE